LNIYVSNLVLKWLQKLWWLEVMEELSRARAWLLYKVIDESNWFYQNNVSKKDRSITNVVFRLEREEQEEKFLKMASEHKMVWLKGHKKVWGIRASIYIPMSYEHVEKLACFMEKFQKENG
jgi:phosphoserine aminotransferase